VGYYFLVFLASFLVDVIPFIGPPAWTVMVFFQMRYGLNIWVVLVTGVIGSALGRYVYSAYIPLLSDKFIKEQTNEDIKFVGARLKKNGWKVQLFVLLYTLMPLPSTPLFTASGMARIKTINIIPAFLVGKFISDAIMVIAGDYVAVNAQNITEGMLTWKTALSTFIGLVIICFFLFIDWRSVLQEKKFRIRFNIWK
jgi:membrane protein YqaA with SNARE-associated domain